MLEKEDNSSKRKDISTWFDQKFSIDRRSQVIPTLKKTSKITQQETPAIPSQNETIEEFQPENPVVAQEVVSSELKFEDENDSEEKNNSESIEASLVNSGTTYFEELLEKILFDSKELDTLKKTIKDLSIGIIKPNQLKKLILKSYIRIFEELVEFIPFYYTQELNKKSIDSNLAEEIREKDKLLEELGERINNIYLKLKERAQDYSDIDDQLELKDRFKQFLEKINEIDEDAELAYEGGRYSDYIQFKYLSSEKLIELLYYRVFNILISDKNEMKINDTVKEIEKQLNVKFGIIKELNKWRITRNMIVHEHLKVEKEQAKQAKLFFNELSNKLNTAFHNC